MLSPEKDAQTQNLSPWQEGFRGPDKPVNPRTHRNPWPQVKIPRVHLSTGPCTESWSLAHAQVTFSGWEMTFLVLALGTSAPGFWSNSLSARLCLSPRRWPRWWYSSPSPSLCLCRPDVLGFCSLICCHGFCFSPAPAPPPLLFPCWPFMALKKLNLIF